MRFELGSFSLRDAHRLCIFELQGVSTMVNTARDNHEKAEGEIIRFRKAFEHQNGKCNKMKSYKRL